MKILQILFIILLFSPPLYAEQAHVLTEIEAIQEKIWYLQRDLTTQKKSLEKYQKQFELLASKTDKIQLDQNEHLTALVQATTNQQNEMSQTESDLNNLTEAFASLTKEIEQRNHTMLEQAGKIGALEGSLQALRTKLAEQKASTDQALAESQQRLIETRSQLETLSQDAGTRIDQLSLWGGGAALFLAIILTISFAFRRNPAKGTSSEREHPPKHEM